MSHFFPQKDTNPSREPLSNDAVLWQGRPSFRTILPSILLCLILGWLIVPIFIAWRIWSKHSNTEYLVTKRYIQIRNDYFDKENRILEIYRVKSVKVDPGRNAGKNNVIFYPTDDYTPPVQYLNVDFSDDELKRIQDVLKEMQEKKRVESISLPVLG